MKLQAQLESPAFVMDLFVPVRPSFAQSTAHQLTWKLPIQIKLVREFSVTLVRRSSKDHNRVRMAGAEGKRPCLTADHHPIIGNRMIARRSFFLLVAATSSVPASAWAQQPARLPTVGILAVGGPVSCASGALGYGPACMVEGLGSLGYVEGRNVAFEYRYARGDYKRLPALAGELVALRPDVVYTTTNPGADAAAKATTTIPIVVGPAGEELMISLVGNLGRPVGNVTGLILGALAQDQKCLQLLKELVPTTTRVAVIHIPDSFSVLSLGALSSAATQLRVTLVRIEVSNLADLPQAFTAVAASGADAIFMFDEPVLAGSSDVRKQVSHWALSHRLPLASSNPAFAAAGGLVSLGADVRSVARRSAHYVDRILRGAKPADLPVEKPTMFTISVNRKTATALNLTIPTSVLVRADEVID